MNIEGRRNTYRISKQPTGRNELRTPGERRRYSVKYAAFWERDEKNVRQEGGEKFYIKTSLATINVIYLM